MAILAAFVAMIGCSPFNKLLKLNDSEQMYTAAIRYYDEGDFQHALQLFQEITPRYASTMRADTIMYYTGCCYYKQGDFSTSGSIFDEYRRTYGRSPQGTRPQRSRPSVPSRSLWSAIPPHPSSASVR